MPTIQGRVIEICPAQSGVSRNGKEWKKQGFVIETPGNYPAKVYLSLFGADRIANNLPSVDTDVTVEFDIESREYNGRWYTDVNAWKVTGTSSQPQDPRPSEATIRQATSTGFSATPSQEQIPQPQQDADELPF